MDERFKGPPLEIKNKEAVEKVIRDFAYERGLIFTVHSPGLMWIVQRACVNTVFFRAVNIAAFRRDKDELLFFVPTVYRIKDWTSVIALDEKSFLCPLKFLYMLSADEMAGVIKVFLEAAWIGAELLNEDNPVQSLNTGKGD